MPDIVLLKVLRHFFENTHTSVYLRELAKKTGTSPFAAKKYADFLVSKAIISDERQGNLRLMKANISNPVYKYLKISYTIHKLQDAGLPEQILKQREKVSSIQLFGSMAKGQDDSRSDVDIVIIGTLKRISFSQVESKLGRQVNAHFFTWSEWKKQASTNKAFYTDVISYGIPLYGGMPLIP